MNRRVVAVVSSVLLVAVTTPAYFIIASLFVMNVRNDEGVVGFSVPVAASVAAVCALVPFGSLVAAVLLERRGKILPGIVVSLLPLGVLAVFWLWISAQSFS